MAVSKAVGPAVILLTLLAMACPVCHAGVSLFKAVERGGAAIEAAPVFATPGNIVRVVVDKSVVKDASSGLDIDIPLPYNDSVLVASNRRVFTAGEWVTWFGEAENQTFSTITLTVFEDTVSGYINLLSGETHQLQCNDNDNCLLFEVDTESFPRAHPMSPIPPVSSRMPTISDGAYGDEYSIAQKNTAGRRLQQLPPEPNTQIDLALLYTNNTRARYTEATIRSLAAAAVAQANNVMTLGVIFRIRLVYLGEIEYPLDAPAHQMSATLNHLSTAGDNYLEEALRVRTRHGADLVALISEDYTACGIGYAPTTLAQLKSGFAFANVASNCLSAYTLAHEMGHNMGNQHDKMNAPATAIYNYSYGYRVPGAASDIMSYDCSYNCPGCAKCPKYGIYSNPNYFGFNGTISKTKTDSRYFPLGNSSTANNVLSMNNLASTVANLRRFRNVTSPIPPTSLKAGACGVVTGTTIRAIPLSWVNPDKGDQIDGFMVSRSQDLGVNWANISMVYGPTYNSTLDRTVVAGRTYSYKFQSFAIQPNPDVRSWIFSSFSAISNTVTC